jgi:hypothetical protein
MAMTFAILFVVASGDHLFAYASSLLLSLPSEGVSLFYRAIEHRIDAR